MKLVFVCLLWLIAIAVWRQLGLRHESDKRQAWKRIQTFLHAHSYIDVCLQWYTFLYLLLMFFMALALWNNIDLILTVPNPDMPVWLLRLSKGSLVVGVLGFVWTTWYGIYDIRQGSWFRMKMKQPFPWLPSKRQDMVIIVNAVPIIFIVMSMQSTARMWMVISGRYGEYGKDVDLALYRENLDLAQVCQYYTVFMFARLNWNFLKDRCQPETLKIVKLAGFQGLHAWVLVGAVYSSFNFGMAYAQAHLCPSVEHYDTAHKKLCTFMWEKVPVIKEHITDVLGAMTMLCVYNMSLVCEFGPIKDALGNAFLKFSGTRQLLLAAQGQPKILHNSRVMSLLRLDQHQTDVLHSCLLTYWCLSVIALNYFSWEFGAKKELLHDARSMKERMQAEEEQTGLIRPAGDCSPARSLTTPLMSVASGEKLQCGADCA